eukprot:scaffold143908_cov17-Tisochrysis_lutea.AAC.1
MLIAPVSGLQLKFECSLRPQEKQAIGHSFACLQDDAKTQLGAMGVLFSTHALAFMVASGFGVAVATRVSNQLGESHGNASRNGTESAGQERGEVTYLYYTSSGRQKNNNIQNLQCSSGKHRHLYYDTGANRPEAGRRSMLVASACSLTTATGVGIVLTAFRDGWAHLYAQEPVVVNMVIECMPLLSLSLLFDSQNVVLSGVLRGCGYQMVGFIANLCTFCLICPFAASYLALPWGAGMGVYGIWIALLSVSALQAAVLCLICFAGFNFEDLVQFSHVLLAEEKAQSRSFGAASGRELAREEVLQDGATGLPVMESDDACTHDVQGGPSSSGSSQQPSFVVI